MRYLFAFFYFLLSFSASANLLHLERAEKTYNIPSKLLKAIAVTESGKQVDGKFIPWPWTLNVEGTPYFYSNKPEAVGALKQFIASGKSNIDVGMMQINLKHHPHAFSSPEEALDPYRNIHYAAQFLTDLKKQTNNWLEAVGRYHSSIPQHHNRYRAQVMKTWQNLDGNDSFMIDDMLLDQLTTDSKLEKRKFISPRPYSIPSFNTISKNPNIKRVVPLKNKARRIQRDGFMSVNQKFFPLEKQKSRVIHVNLQKRNIPLISVNNPPQNSSVQAKKPYPIKTIDYSKKTEKADV